jgi:hypothetical protein
MKIDSIIPISTGFKHYNSGLIMIILIFSARLITAQNFEKISNPKLNLEFLVTYPFSSNLQLDVDNQAIDDSTHNTIKPRLLPQNISLMENFMWGENGLLRKIGIVSELTPEQRKYELKIRRTMLTAHQIGGFVTIGLMLAGDYFGQKIIDQGKNRSDAHQSLERITIYSYSLTGLLAILSPPPMIRRDDFSTISIHKTLAWIHLAGMIITPILGSMIREHHRVLNMDKAHFHQMSGYITTAVFAASMVIMTF